MSKDLNKVQIIGRLGADVETRYTPSGANVTTFSVASGRSYKDAEGNAREETEWFSVVAWNKLGEVCAQYLRKGSRVYIEGRLQTRSWEDAESGQKRYKTEVIAGDMIMLDGRRQDDGDPGPEEPPLRPQQRNVPQPAPAGGTARPGSGKPAQSTPQRPAAPPRRPPMIVEDDEDLPF